MSVVTEELDVVSELSAVVMLLTDFIRDFGDGLLEAVQQQNPPVYDGHPDP